MGKRRTILTLVIPGNDPESSCYEGDGLKRRVCSLSANLSAIALGRRRKLEERRREETFNLGEAGYYKGDVFHQ